MRSKNVVYMYVTDDDLELPIFIADTATEVSLMAGLAANAASDALYKERRRGSKSRFKRVVIED